MPTSSEKHCSDVLALSICVHPENCTSAWHLRTACCLRSCIVVLPWGPWGGWRQRRPINALPSLARSAFQLMILSVVLGGASTARTFRTWYVLHELPAEVCRDGQAGMVNSSG